MPFASSRVMSRSARLYIWATVVAGAFALAYGLVPFRSDDLPRFICYFLISNLVSGFKVRLPGITGTMSTNFFFVLICITTLQPSETLTIACFGTILQCLWRARSKPSLVKIVFNVASISLAVAATSYWYHSQVLSRFGVRQPVILLIAACVYFFANTWPVAVIVSLTERKTLVKVWRECYFWSFPYYLVGAAIAGFMPTLNRLLGWETALLMFPILFWTYRSYSLYLDRLETEKRHAEDIAKLHLRTIEALALAIEAKDFNTYDHLRRVGVYAREIGQRLELPEDQLQALQAASLLHDIGKLAVPEHILSKPGPLKPVEFDKIKIHPLIGAEILERVEFPYPVVPIVRAHHEKWDGSGYPDGLKGEQIPIGARILSVVDCFDAMTSDRQYRRAVSPRDAIDYIVAQAGKSFDPSVVEILASKQVELEAVLALEPIRGACLSRDVKVIRGDAPAAGFEAPEHKTSVDDPEFLTSIAAARQEAQQLFELTHDLGTSLSLDETLSVLALRLKRICHYDCIAIYVLHDQILSPQYVNGENFSLFAGLKIPLGEGLSGWVAQTKRPIVNGNPSVEPGYLDDPTRFSTLRSAMAVPLEGLNGVVGVLTLYSKRSEAFTPDHLRVLSAVTGKIAFSIENALKYRQAESSATTDALTDLPNARSLFLHLDAELARCKRSSEPLSVLVCDLDGFKQVNDRFGHLEGNKVLREVAQALRKTCREYDYVARMGGDEFVIILPGYPTDVLVEKVAALQSAGRIAGNQVIGENLLSLSIGQASYPADGGDAEGLLAEADRCMYKNKEEHKRRSATRGILNLASHGLPAASTAAAVNL
jgi:diguanylate cyclase (GGDEF)-like protein/putative nucleotidyltransferase with HDIG domain